MHTKWIVGALAAALWIAPAGAQTGSTSGGMERPHANGNGSDPSRSTTDTNTQSGSVGKTDRSTSTDTAATTGTGSHASTDRDMPSGGAPGPAGSGGMTAGSTSSGTGTSSADTTAPAGGSPGPAGSASTSSGHPTGAMGSGASTADATAGTAASETASTLAKLHDGNQAEVEAGTWMREHAQSSKVKDFAKKMVDDHSKMDKDVMSFAQKKNIDLASAPRSAERKDAEHQMESIKSMKGAQADRAYMDMMVQDHEKDVSETRQAEQTAKSGHDDELAKLLDKSAKKMEGHLKDAQKIQRDLTQRQARNPNQ